MQKKNLRFGWSAGVLGLLVLGLTACGSAQKDTKQSEVAPVAEQSLEESVPLEPEIPTQQPVVVENEPVKLNPPHGEPGHRCEIPVGSPLDGSAAVDAPAVTNAPAPPAASKPVSLAPTVENAQRLNATQGTQSTAPATGEKPQFNPPHGQPWHRCDIAVGAPLS